MSVVCQINCVGGITRTKHAHAQSQGLDCKANRASETEEQRKERLRIRRENRKPRETVPGHSQKIEAR